MDPPGVLHEFPWELVPDDLGMLTIWERDWEEKGSIYFLLSAVDYEQKFSPKEFIAQALLAVDISALF